MASFRVMVKVGVRVSVRPFLSVTKQQKPKSRDSALASESVKATLTLCSALPVYLIHNNSIWISSFFLHTVTINITYEMALKRQDHYSTLQITEQDHFSKLCSWRSKAQRNLTFSAGWR